MDTIQLITRLIKKDIFEKMSLGLELRMKFMYINKHFYNYFIL